jgi:3-hydroxy-3-methylglutaryl CoA synthase
MASADGRDVHPVAEDIAAVDDDDVADIDAGACAVATKINGNRLVARGQREVARVLDDLDAYGRNAGSEHI